jgi:hypothetical protein
MAERGDTVVERELLIATVEPTQGCIVQLVRPLFLASTA